MASAPLLNIVTSYMDIAFPPSCQVDVTLTETEMGHCARHTEAHNDRITKRAALHSCDDKVLKTREGEQGEEETMEENEERIS